MDIIHKKHGSFNLCSIHIVSVCALHLCKMQSKHYSCVIEIKMNEVENKMKTEFSQ